MAKALVYIFRVAWAESGAWSRFAILAFATLPNLVSSPVVEWAWPMTWGAPPETIPLAWSLGIMGAVIVVALLATVSKRARNLDDKFVPRIVINFHHTPSYERFHDFGKGHTTSQLRIGIDNVSATAIRRIKVELEKMTRLSDMDDSFNHNIPSVLKQWDDNPSPSMPTVGHRTEFDLNPGSPEMLIDLVQITTTSADQRPLIGLCYASLGISSMGRSNAVPNEKYEIEIVATSPDMASAVRRRFVVEQCGVYLSLEPVVNGSW